MYNFSYIVTYAPPKSRYTADAAEAIRIWDTRISDMKRAFPGGFGIVKAWPHFKWSHDDKYFASMRDDVISIYESEVSMVEGGGGFETANTGGGGYHETEVDGGG